MKLKFTLLLLFILNSLAQGQTKQTIVGIIPFKYTNKEYESRAAELTEIVSSTFSSNKKISVLARDKVNLIKKELNLQKDFEYTDGITVPQNKAHGAQMIVIGNLTNIDVETRKIGGGASRLLSGSDNSGATTYKSKVSFSLQAFDVATGKLLSSKTYDLKASDGSMSFENVYKVEGDAAKNAILTNKKLILESVKEFASDLFPPAIKIATIDKTDKKGRPQLVSIIASKEDDLDIKLGTIIIINEILEVMIDNDVRKREVEVVKLKVSEFQGEFIQCEVLKGNEVLEDKVKNAKLKYVVVSGAKKS